MSRSLSFRSILNVVLSQPNISLFVIQPTKEQLIFFKTLRLSTVIKWLVLHEVRLVAVHTICVLMLRTYRASTAAADCMYGHQTDFM